MFFSLVNSRYTTGTLTHTRRTRVERAGATRHGEGHGPTDGSSAGWPLAPKQKTRGGNVVEGGDERGGGCCTKSSASFFLKSRYHGTMVYYAPPYAKGLFFFYCTPTAQARRARHLSVYRPLFPYRWERGRERKELGALWSAPKCWPSLPSIEEESACDLYWPRSKTTNVPVFLPHLDHHTAAQVSLHPNSPKNSISLFLFGFNYLKFWHARYWEYKSKREREESIVK